MGFVKFSLKKEKDEPERDHQIENTTKEATVSNPEIEISSESESEETPAACQEGNQLLHANNLRKIISQLTEKTHQGYRNIEELKKAIEQIASAAEETAGACEETLSAVTEIRQNSHFLKAETKQVVGAINNIRRIFIEASDNLRETKAGVEEISRKSNTIASRIDDLFTKDGGITDIVNLITKLAKRTSLLALNAAIEAARAKEKGKSFAAIAAEIRTMASKSDSYATRIRNIIEDIQAKIKSTRDNILSSGDNVKSISHDVEETVSKMAELNRQLEASTDLMNELQKSVDKLVGEIEAVHKGSETIAAAAEEAAGAANQINATTSTQVVAFKQTKEAIELLEAASERIKRGENVYKVASEVATASAETQSSVEELESTLEQTVEALEQSKQAAEISKDDAVKNAEVIESCVTHVERAFERVKEVQNKLHNILKEYEKVLENIRTMRNSLRKNIIDCEQFKTELNEVKTKIVRLHNAIRKIELAIVQTAALSISGAVEAIRVGSLGVGFSEVSKDIRNLATTSEEHLDKVIETIDKVSEGTELLVTEINNIILTQERENQKLLRLETEFNKNKNALIDSINSLDKLAKSIEEIKVAIEQSQLALNQISEAAEIAFENTASAKEAAEDILRIVGDMRRIVSELNVLAEELSRGTEDEGRPA